MNYYSVTTYDEYIQHHGILGQKWGVRRFQNEDGSLTSAGKHRAKSAARAYYKAQMNKMSMKDSVTEHARKKHAAAYEKNMSNYNEAKKELGKDVDDYGRKEISKFRRGAFRHQSATLAASKYAAIGSSFVNGTFGAGITVSGLLSANPALVAYGSSFVASAVVDAAAAAALTKTAAPSVARSRSYYSEEYEKLNK